jgi:hypothetical protein
VVTADATGTQTATAAYIVGRGGHYVFTVKGNQPGLFARCKTLPWAKIRAVSAVEVGHGRRVRRTIKVAAAPVLLDFAGAVQVAQIRRTRTRAGNKSVKVVYIITSTPSHEASALQIAAWCRDTGASRTSCTGSATSSSTKTAPASARATRPGSWPPCAPPRSASYA